MIEVVSFLFSFVVIILILRVWWASYRDRRHTFQQMDRRQRMKLSGGMARRLPASRAIPFYGNPMGDGATHQLDGSPSRRRGDPRTLADMKLNPETMQYLLKQYLKARKDS